MKNPGHALAYFVHQRLSKFSPPPSIAQLISDNSGPDVYKNSWYVAERFKLLNFSLKNTTRSKATHLYSKTRSLELTNDK